jgi:hypothetical protein
MAKTKEEILKEVEKNYFEVQKQELDAYDKTKMLRKNLDKDIKSLSKSLDGELDIHKQTAKKDKELFKSKAKNIAEDDTTQKEGNAAKKADAEKAYQETMALIKENYEKEIKSADKEISDQTKKHEEEKETAQSTYDKKVLDLKKDIDDLTVKKDKAVKQLDKKIEDLKAKHEAKVQKLQEKEVKNVEKENASFAEKQAKLNENITDERAKTDKKISDIVPVYEEELEEIEDKIESDKAAFDAKYKSIEDSAQKRIDVREKHLQRAIDENDKRSAKQHKKDISKFTKDRDKDLQILKQSYNKDKAQAADYRKNFIKDHFAKLSKLEEKFAEFKNKQEAKLQTLKVKHSQTLLDFTHDTKKSIEEALIDLSKEVYKLNVERNQMIKNTALSVAKIDNEIKELAIQFTKDFELRDSNHKLTLEGLERNKKESEVVKIKKEELAKNELNNELAKLTHQLKTIVAETNLKVFINEKEFIKTQFKNTHEEQTSYKNELLEYESKFEPVFIERANEINEYEVLEAKQTAKVKVAFLEETKKAVEADYKDIVSKIKDAHKTEVKYYQDEIDKVASDAKKELKNFIENHAKEIETFDQSLNALSDSKEDRKLRKQKEKERQDKIDKYESDKLKLESEINRKTNLYQTAIDQANKRLETGLENANKLKDVNIAAIAKSIDVTNGNLAIALEDAKIKKASIEEAAKGFKQSAGNVNSVHSDEIKAYLDKQVATVDNEIKTMQLETDAIKSKSSSELDGKLNDLAAEKERILNKSDQSMKELEQHFEIFKQKISQTNIATEEKTKQLQAQQKSNYRAQTNEIDSVFEKANSDAEDQRDNKIETANKLIRDEQSKQESEHKALESNISSIEKDFEKTLKTVLSEIQSKLSTDISNIQ